MLHLAQIPGHVLDPVAAWEYMLSLTPGANLEGPAFVFPTQTGYKTLTHTTLVKFINTTIAKIGLDPKQYSGHSLRRGGCTFAFQAGVNMDLIRKHGDWLSSAYQRYLEFPEESRLLVTRTMGNHLTDTPLASLVPNTQLQ